MIDQFPGNSHKADREKTEETLPDKTTIEPVTLTGKVVKRKKSLGRRIMDTFFSGDTNSVFGYLLRDVLVPALQATATDLVTQGIQKAVYGDARSSQRGFRPGQAARTHVSYDRYAPTRPTTAITPTTPRDRRPVRPSAFQMGEIILDTRIDAELIVDQMHALIEKYGMLTVADLNNLIGQTSEYTDHKWGWENLRGTDIRAIREGFLLVLPAPEDLR